MIFQRCFQITGRAITGAVTSNFGRVFAFSYMASLQAKPVVGSGMDCCQHLFCVCTSVCLHGPGPDEHLWAKEQGYQDKEHHTGSECNHTSKTSTRWCPNSTVLHFFYTKIYYQIFRIDITVYPFHPLLPFAAVQLRVDFS